MEPGSFSTSASGGDNVIRECEVTSTSVEATVPPTEIETDATTAEALENLRVQSESSAPDATCMAPCGDEAVDTERVASSEGLVEPRAVVQEAAKVHEDERASNEKPMHEGSVASWVDAVVSSPAEDVVILNEGDMSFAKMFSTVAEVNENGDEDKGGKTKGRKEKKRANEGGHGASKGGKRARTESTKAVEVREKDFALRAFKHSQRSLRKEVKGLSMKDVLARSQAFSGNNDVSLGESEDASPVPSPSATGTFTFPNSGFFSSTADSNPFSPISGANVNSLLSPASPTSGGGGPTTPASPWSPALVSDITKSFLANVERQKKQTVERLLPRDLATPNAQANVPSPRAHHGNAGNGFGKGRRVTPPPPTLIPLSSPPTGREAKSRTDAFPPEPVVSPSITAAVMEELLGVEGGKDEEASSNNNDNSTCGTFPGKFADSFAVAGSAQRSKGGEDDAETYSEEEEQVREDLVIRENAEEEEEAGEATINHPYAVSYASEHSLRLREVSGGLVSRRHIAAVSASASFISFPSEHSLSVLDGSSGGVPHHPSSGLLPTLPNTNSHLSASQLQLDEASQQRLQEQQRKQEEAAEEAITRAATRRHEIWKLKQRSIKAQRLLHAAGASTSATVSKSAEGHATGAKGSVSAPSSSQSLEGSKGVVEGVMRKFTTSTEDNTFATTMRSSPSTSSTHVANSKAPLGPFDVNGPGSPTLLTNRKGFSSIRDVNLSQSDVSMIVRLNSFDRTSSQKIVVFGTVASAAKEAEGKKNGASK